MLTTVSGIGVLVVAITPILGQFGLLTAVTVLYSYLASVIALPPAFVVWARVVNDDAVALGADVETSE